MKRPRTRHSTGAAKQLSFLPEPPFCPKLPSRNSVAWDLLAVLLRAESLTQIDWLRLGYGWRLAAAVKELNYGGWGVQSSRIQDPQSDKAIAEYSLTARAKRAARKLFKSADMRLGGRHV